MSCFKGGCRVNTRSLTDEVACWPNRLANICGEAQLGGSGHLSGPRVLVKQLDLPVPTYSYRLPTVHSVNTTILGECRWSRQSRLIPSTLAIQLNFSREAHLSATFEWVSKWALNGNFRTMNGWQFEWLLKEGFCLLSFSFRWAKQSGFFYGEICLIALETFSPV